MDIFAGEKNKKFASSCLNRELKSHQMNCVQDRLLKESNNRVDRYQMKESKSQRYIRDGIKKDHDGIVRRTPSVTEWMRQQQHHLDAWKERERQRLENKYKYSIRQYKVPRVVSLDSSGMPLTFNSSGHIGRTDDSDDDEDDVFRRPSTSYMKRTVSDAGDRPKTSRPRRRGTIHIDTRIDRYPRRAKSAAAGDIFQSTFS